ncbi:transporter substrate-binding domain-containing protein [Lentilactobacillus sp. SPB1-3]|uniref:Transporter substrate-binding domain-containing protein n=1 Tax=Lentilactobacillus terminaliae TaxID=3003483 RepID=A0ACD5DEW0_9LACO|nr:transporter substrate-binding domain-containing protein [Lentilactobacillus sp. SPB1-3]MCZ0976447.1 transporter substrate-binding domain-containing protein [Lentilactobacillus sp. SPB1-3]
MKRKHTLSFIGLFGALAILLVLITGCGKSNSSQGPITVATSGTLYPTSFHDEKTNKLTGFDVEIVRAVAKKLNRKVEFKEMNVAGQLTAVKTGKVDMAANDFSVSPARKKQFILSTPYKHSWNSIVVRKKDNSGIHSWADIKGKRAAGEAGTGYQKLAKQLGAKTVNYNNVANSVYLKDVKNGRTDFIMNDYYLQKLALSAVPNNGLKIMTNMFFTTSDDGAGTGIVMKKSDTKLAKQVNKALKELKKDGTLKKIAMKYYKADVTKKPTAKISKHFVIK